uniref:Homeobox domain-containing protein n=1 Tax=Caenorhabditis tropicalis TaxID=1561998 RepID=A0A1I7T696_9PELO
METTTQMVCNLSHDEFRILYQRYELGAPILLEECDALQKAIGIPGSEIKNWLESQWRREPVSRKNAKLFEDAFWISIYPSWETVKELMAQTGLSRHTITEWFRESRQRLDFQEYDPDIDSDEKAIKMEEEETYQDPDIQNVLDDNQDYLARLWNRFFLAPRQPPCFENKGFFFLFQCYRFQHEPKHFSISIAFSLPEARALSGLIGGDPEKISNWFKNRRNDPKPTRKLDKETEGIIDRLLREAYESAKFFDKKHQIPNESKGYDRKSRKAYYEKKLNAGEWINPQERNSLIKKLKFSAEEIANLPLMRQDSKLRPPPLEKLFEGELNDSSRDQILQPNYLGASEDNSSELEGLTVQSNNIEVYEHNPNQFAIDSYFNLNGANNLSSGQFGAPEAQRNQFVVSIIYSNQSQDYQHQDLIVQNHSNQEPIVQNFQHPNSIAQIYQNHDPNIQNNQQNNFYAQNDQNQDPCAHNQPQYYPNSLENETFYSNPPYSNSIQYENQVMPPRNDSGYSDHATPEFYEPAIQPADQFQG